MNIEGTRKAESDEALKKFLSENSVINDDEYFKYNEDDYNSVLDKRPWKKDPNYFKKVKISALALIKMVTHARFGGNIEIMGLMQGRVQGDTFIICDAFALPVEGTETRVNAGAGANEYMSQYIDSCEKASRKEFACGWYHSHPSFGCWLSGIDVSTQNLYQYQDPWLAIVIDPIRTMTSGKVEIGAFRTYPENYSPLGEVSVEDQIIPMEKIEDFGVHYKRYYSLEISYFKTSLDNDIIQVLWNKYWVSTLSQSPLITNKKYFSDGCMDLYKKAQKMAKNIRKEKKSIEDLKSKERKQDHKDFIKYSLERNQALFGETVKNLLFSHKI